jgi:RecA/RadA recombinase
MSEEVKTPDLLEVIDEVHVALEDLKDQVKDKREKVAKDDTEKIKKILTTKRKKAPIDLKSALSTGSTLLNLASTGDPNVGIIPGSINLLVGDSASGKTFLTLTCLAEAARNPKFKDYRFIFDDVEGGAKMNMEKFFGSKMADRLEPPAWHKKTAEWVNSTTIEEFYYHLDDAVQDGRPFIYILDSMDALSSEAEHDKFQQQKEAHRKGKEVSGSMGDGKAKKNSSGTRQALADIRDTKSILWIITQTRDAIGFGAQFNPKSRSGGRALRFYADLEFWSSIGGQIKKNLPARLGGGTEKTGIECIIKVKKNRIAGREPEIMLPIYYSVGFDDTGSCVRYLIERKRWVKGKGGDEGDDDVEEVEEVEEKKGKKTGVYNAKDLGIVGKEEDLIRQIEEKGLERDLKMVVAEVWKEVEEEATVIRKSRYT